MSYISDNFAMFSEICECIASQFGSNCEVVLHDLTKPYDSTIVAIYNGHVTGRKVGDGGTNAGLALLRGMKEPEDQYNYVNHTEDGRVLRSSSKYIQENGKVVGSLCINMDITDFIKGQKALNTISLLGIQNLGEAEVFKGSIDETLDYMMRQEVELMGKPVELLNKEEKCLLVNNLDKKGAFLIKKSAERVAEFLGLSRFTIYNYLNKNKEDEHNEKDSDKERSDI